MAVFVAFLRGVNVAGHRRIKMEALRKAHEAMKHSHVETMLQSGNVIFECGVKGRKKLTAEIEEAYRDRLGLSTTVLLRSAGELDRIVGRCPIALGSKRDPKFLHAVLLADAPGSDAADSLMAYDGPEEIRLAGDTLYVYYTHGSGRSKLTLDRIEKALGVAATARNWNTITKLRDLAARR